MSFGDPLPVLLDDHRWMWLVTDCGSVGDQPTAGDVVQAAHSHGIELVDTSGVLWVDGRPIALDHPLAAIPLRAASRVGAGGYPPHVEAPNHSNGVAEVGVVAGPCAGAGAVLRHGRHLVGGVPGAGVAVDNSAPHAAVIEVHAGDERPVLRVTPVGEVAATIDGVFVGSQASWLPGTTLTLGRHSLRWWPSDRRAPVPNSEEGRDGPWHVVQRRGRSLASPSPARSTVTTAVSTTPRPPLLPAGVAAMTAAVVAAVTRQPLLALFAVTSLAATGVWWGIVVLRDLIRRRRERVADRGERDALAHRLQSTRMELHTVVPVARRRQPGLWERRADRHADAWDVVVGRGRVWQGLDTWVDDIPAVVGLHPGARVGLGGAGAVSLARAFVAQLLTHVGPADVRLSVYEWPQHRHFGDLRVTPQVRSSAVHEVVLVVDPPPTVVPLTLVSSQAALLVVDSHPRDRVGAWCTTVIRWDGEASLASIVVEGEVVAEVAPAGAASELLHEVVVAVAGCWDPEAQGSCGILEPVSEASWRSLHHHDLTPASVLQRWAIHPPVWTAALGRGDAGPITVDLARDGPHALVAGTTGSGKSELLRTLVLGWAWNASPEHLQFILIDYKGGAAFDACLRLPHVVGVVTDLDGRLAARVLAGLRAELTRREHLLRTRGVSNLAQWDLRRDQVDWSPLARLVIVVDELAALVQELPDVVTSLVALAQRGRSLGVHLVLATQRPAGVVRDDIRANTELRVCLRVADPADATDVIGDARPARYARGRPGRALVRRGAGEVEELQVADTSAPWCSEARPVRLVPLHSDWEADDHTVAEPHPVVPSTLSTVVAALAEAARAGNLATPDPLWQPPLPTVLPNEHDCAVLGMLDDVAHRAWLPLRCDPARHALVVGGPGSGVTTALRRIVASRPGHEIVELAGHMPCAAAMDRLMVILDERRDSTASRWPVSVVIDGVAAMRRRWEDELGPAAWRVAAMWDRLLGEGPALGVTVVAAADRVASCGSTLVSVATTRWLLRPLDPMDPGFLGVRITPEEYRDWPPGRFVDAETGLVGQVAFSTPSTMCTVRSA